MAVAGDILEQPEAGWKRYELLSYPIDEYPQINVFEENRIIIQTPGNPADKIKIGSKIRVFGKIRNALNKFIQENNSMDIGIGPYPYAAKITYPAMPLTDNKYTLIAEIELTAVYFLSTFIRFRGRNEYNESQAVFSAIDIFEEANSTPTSSLPSGTYETGKTVILSSATPGALIRYTIDGTEPTGVSQLYSNPIVVSESSIIKAKAYKIGYIDSDILVLEINIIPPITPTRYIRPPKITVKENIVKIESHYKIYYTTDGSYPNSTSLQYTGHTVPISMPPNTTIITAIAFSQQNLSFSHPTQHTLYPQPTTTIYPPQ